MKGKKWKPDAAFISKKKLEKEDETHADGIDLKQQAKDQTFFQGTTKSGEELAAIESELDKTAQWEAELKAKQDALLAERNKALQDDINTKARRKKERYQRLWGPILILYPTFHAGLAIFTIFMGNIILNSTCEEGTTRDQEDAAESSGCSAPLDGLPSIVVLPHRFPSKHSLFLIQCSSEQPSLLVTSSCFFSLGC